jgi:hypothetical protein
VFWCTNVIPAFRRIRQEDLKLETSLDYIVSPYLNKRGRGELEEWPKWNSNCLASTTSLVQSVVVPKTK